MTDPTATSRRTVPRRAFGKFAHSMPQTIFPSFHRAFILLAVLLTSLSFLEVQPAQAVPSNPQPAILTALDTSNQIVVYPNASQSPTPTQKLVSGLPADAKPEGVSFYGSDNALVSSSTSARIFVIQVSTATLLATIDASTVGYYGGGTIAVAPDRNTALVANNNGFVNVIHGPFNASSSITKVALPTTANIDHGQTQGIAYGQTQGIVFNNAGRAFVYTTTGISVLDAPYTSIAFTIPVSNGNGGAIGISPDGNTLLATNLTDTINIFSAPLSASSTPATLAVTGASGLDGIMVTPDSTKALVVDAESHNAFAISAPFTASSNVDTLPLPTGTEGFEDVGISADSQTAIITGNDSGSEAPIFVRAPFTAVGATTYYVPVASTNIGRGTGSVRFEPPGLAPGLTITKSAPATAASNGTLTYTLTYANTGSVNASSVIIRDPLPAGTTFISATNGGTLSNGSVVFNVGVVNGNISSQTVSFTVHITAAQGATITNSGYTIEASGVAPIPGPPVTTTVTTAIALNGQVSGYGTINTAGNNRGNFGFSATTVNGGPQATGTFTFSRNGGPTIVGTAIQSLTFNNAGTSATFSGVYTLGKQPNAQVIAFVVTVTHNLGSSDTFSVQLYKPGSLTPYYNAGGNLTNGYISISGSGSQAA